MHDELKSAMAAIEALEVDLALPASHRRAALAGLGSKFLAIGSPESIGLADCGDDAAALYACHEIQFGPLKIRAAGDNRLETPTDISHCSIEESMACDLVCLSTTQAFAPEWIADATHLNIVDTGPWSAGMQALADNATITWVGTPRHSLRSTHGSLADVIRGKVSGRMGEEITCLLWTPENTAT